MKNTFLIIIGLLLTSCSKYFVEEKHGVKINGLSINYSELMIGFGAVFIGLTLMLLYLYIDSKFEESNNSILKFVKKSSMILGFPILIIGGIFLIPLIALIEYIAWYIFGAILIVGLLISIFKR